MPTESDPTLTNIKNERRSLNTTTMKSSLLAGNEDRLGSSPAPSKLVGKEEECQSHDSLYWQGIGQQIKSRP